MRKKWISCILTVVALLWIFALPVMAEEDYTVLMPVESESLGSITIQLEDVNGIQSKGGIALSVVQVADVVNGEFKLKEEYEDSELDLNKIKTASELEYAAEVLRRAVVSVDETVITDDNGNAVIKNLPVGVYLVYATDNVNYKNIAASLISIPTFNEAEEIMHYDIKMFPKYSAVQEIPKTGDSSGLLLYGMVLVLSMTLVVGMNVLLRYKRTKSNDNSQM